MQQSIVWSEEDETRLRPRYHRASVDPEKLRLAEVARFSSHGRDTSRDNKRDTCVASDRSRGQKLRRSCRRTFRSVFSSTWFFSGRPRDGFFCRAISDFAQFAPSPLAIIIGSFSHKGRSSFTCHRRTRERAELPRDSTHVAIRIYRAVFPSPSLVALVHVLRAV